MTFALVFLGYASEVISAAPLILILFLFVINYLLVELLDKGLVSIIQ